MLVPPFREPLYIGAGPRASRVPFPKRRPVVLPMVRFGLPKPDGTACSNADSDLMLHQFRLSVLQWNPGAARRQPTQIIAATVTDQFTAYTGNTDLAILLNKDTFEPDPAVFAFQEASSSKDTWCMVVLVVRGLLRRLPFLALPRSRFALSTSTMLWPRNAMPPPTCSVAYTRTCCSTTSTSLGVTST